MASKSKPHENPGSGKCPVSFALDVFGDRWSLLIIRDMVFRGKHHFGEFTLSSEKISTNILASRLAKLETEGILTKTTDTENLSKFYYALTPKGIDLLPVILEMIIWSATHDPQPNGLLNIIHGAPSDLLERAKNDRAALVSDLIANMK